MTFDLGFFRLTFLLTGPSEPWYASIVFGILLGLVGVVIYHCFFDR